MAEYIDRDAVTEYLMGRIKGYREMGDRLAIIPLNFAMAHIKSLPAADVEPVRHGRCEFCKDGKTFIGAIAMGGNDGRFHRICYCPNCGAKMDGGADDAAD